MASASDTALSINLVMNSAIKGANFLQASTKGIYKYSAQVQKINLLRATKFGMLNKNIKTLDNHLTKISTKASYISKHPIKLDVNRDNLMEARKDLTAMAKDSQTIYNYSKLTNQKLSQRQKPQKRATTASDVIGTVMAVSAIALPFKASIDFESEMARVKALSNAKPLEFQALVKEAKHLGATTDWKATEVAQGMQFLSMAGFKAQDTKKAMKGVLALATAGKTDLATTSDIASNILTGFSLKAEDMTKVADIMAKTITTANVDVSMLGDTMKYAAPSASRLGASLTEVATLSAKMGDVGIQGSMAGTAIRTMYTRLSAPPTEGKKALEALGVSAYDSNGKFKGMINIIGELNSALAGVSEQQKSDYLKKIFGVEALSGATAVLKIGKKELIEYQNTLEHSTGSAEKIQKIQLATTAGQFKLLGSAIEGLSISATTGLLPAIKTVTGMLTGLATGLTYMSDTFPTLTSVVLGLGVAFVGGSIALATFGFVSTMASAGLTRLSFLGSAVGWMRGFSLATTLATAKQWLFNASVMASNFASLGIVKSAIGWLRSFSLATTLATAKQWLLNLAMNANPVGLMITGVSALIGLGVLLYNKFEPVRKLFDGIGGAIKKVVSSVVDFSKSVGGKILSFFGFGDDEKKQATATKTEIKTSLKSANNTDYKPVLTGDKKTPLAVSSTQTSSTEILKEPSYYTPQKTFNEVNSTQVRGQTLNSFGGSSNVNVNINGIHVQVQTTDGKFNHEEFVEQVEEALKEIDWDRQNLSHKDVA